MREGESVPVLSDEIKEQMKDYLDAVPIHNASPITSAQQNHLYDGLSIIDSKAQALLSFNSFLLAIVGIYFGTVQSLRDEPWLLIPFLVTLIASGASCLLCLDVVWVHWLTASDMRLTRKYENVQTSHGFIELLLLRDERTRTYRIAWLLSFLSVGSVVMGVLIAVFADYLPN